MSGLVVVSGGRVRGVGFLCIEKPADPIKVAVKIGP